MGLNTGERKDITYFTGYEVEHTICHGKFTLFVVGTPPTKEILKKAKKLKVEHIYFGTSQSFPNIKNTDAEEWAKWETVIKKWEMLSMKFSEVEKEQWIRKSRRINSFNNGLILPSNSEIECLHMCKNKINVYFFLDTSGSCIHLAERFFTAANSLPKEKFDIKLFCFDTNVEEVSLQSQKVYGGGGTSFNIIEKKIQEEKIKTKKYPSAVFIITDGYGNKVNPEHPNRWHWFLSSDNKQFIPTTSFSYDLTDFE